MNVNDPGGDRGPERAGVRRCLRRRLDRLDVDEYADLATLLRK